MLLMVLRKMMSNKWMVMCLLLGTILAVGMVSSIPMYTEGVLNRMLRRDLEQAQLSSRTYSGRWLVKIPIDINYEPDNRPGAWEFFSYYIPIYLNDIPVNRHFDTRTLTSSAFRATFTPNITYPEGKATVRVQTLTGIMDHVYVPENLGAAPVAGLKRENGMIVAEVMMSYRFMVKNEYSLGQEFRLADFNDRFDDVLIRVVGAFEPNSAVDSYWYSGLALAEEGFIMHESDFLELFVHDKERFSLASGEWYSAIDYAQIQLTNLADTIGVLDQQIRFFEGYNTGPLKVPMMPILENYANREAQLRTMLLVLQVPILLMLAFYIFMVAQLIVDYERNEISVLKSRGAGRGGILATYLVENLVIGAISIVVGPILGWLICSILGASNGFLEFVSRSALSIRVNLNAVLLSLVTVAFTVAMMLIPVLLQSRRSIVEQKTAKARRGMPLWQKLFLDFVLVALSFYGLYTYQMRQETLAATIADNAMQVPIDPLLFMISTLFVLGIGLLFLRFFPWLVRLVFAIGKKLWSPALYASFISVGRSGGQEQFLMLFLVLTLSLGIFNANAARTINQNIEEKFDYTVGADIVVQQYWPSNALIADPMTESGPGSAPSLSFSAVNQRDAGYGNDAIVIYSEPEFAPWETLDGVEEITKVFVNNKVTAEIVAQSSQASRLMAIESASFGRVTRMPDGLLRPHYNEWLNQLAGNPKACLLSRVYRDELNVRPGDTIQVTWSRQQKLELIVYGFFDYWPTYNQYLTMQSANKLIVCNLAYLQAKMAVEPYQIWIRRAEGATSQMIYEAIEENKLSIVSLTDSTQKLVEMKNEPMLQGANGAMTMGFIVTMLVSAVGFIIYWILSIKNRVLQFGILRAMGLSFRKLIGMLLAEQLLISGSAIIVGMLTGGLASQLFVPMLQMVYSAQSQVPPFRVIADNSDYGKIYIIVGLMLVVGLIVLARLIAKIKITQALKLGED